MSTIKQGFCWHVYHDELLSWCYDYKAGYDGRVAYIKKHKPAHEVELRLKFIKFVVGQLPKDLVEAGQEYGDAERKHNEAWRKYDEAGRKCDETGQEYYKAMLKYTEAMRKYTELLKKHKDFIEDLHKKECPDCSWNGEELIFEHR